MGASAYFGSAAADLVYFVLGTRLIRLGIRAICAESTDARSRRERPERDSCVSHPGSDTLLNRAASSERFRAPIVPGVTSLGE